MKKIITFMWCCLLFAPCLLALTESTEGTVTVWNFVGLAWGVVLFFTLGKLLPAWMKEILKEMADDE